METQQFLKREERGVKSLKKAAILRGMIAVHYAVTVALFLCCWIIFYRMPAERGEYFVHDRSICAAYILLLLVFSRIYSCYKIGMYRIRDLVNGQLFASLMSWGVTYFLACVMAQKLLNPSMGFVFLILQMLFGTVWTVYMNKVYFRSYKPRQTVILYRSQNDLNKMKELELFRYKCRVAKCLRCSSQAAGMIDESADNEELIDEDIRQIMNVIDEYDAVVVAGVNATLRNGIVKHCVEKKKDCYFVPHTGDVMIAGATHMKAYSVPVFRVRRSNPAPEFLLLKRVFDICASGAALFVLWPVMLITAIMIKCYDHGPALYKQTRLTKDGKTFEVLKFRSMRVSAESDGVARLATENDDRITPVGKVIRAIRFDELPQLINIIKGDMSIVGPRPERPEIAEQYAKDLPAFNLRLQVKAGLTGYAQVYGRYNTEPADKLKMDLMYINNMGVVEDLRLIVATIQILFQKDSTQGIKSSKVAKISKENI